MEINRPVGGGCQIIVVKSILIRMKTLGIEEGFSFSHFFHIHCFQFLSFLLTC